MFALISDITMGEYSMVKAHEVKIEKSIYSYVDTALIKLPITAIIKESGIASYTQDTAKQFKEGDKITIKLGYNGVLKNEFDGFIVRINIASPLEIQCEGYSYQLRKNNYSKNFYKTTLLDILQFLIKGTDIILDVANIPHFPIDKLIIFKKSGTDVLMMIKELSFETIKIYFTRNLLTAGLRDLKIKGDVEYRIGWNTINEDKLSKREAGNDVFIVNFTGLKNDGSMVKATTTSKISTSQISENKHLYKNFSSHQITDYSSLKLMSDAENSKLSYNGYEGKLLCFGVPYCEPGYRAILKDDKYEERGGNYLVVTTEVVYGMNGFRRTVEIGHQL